MTMSIRFFSPFLATIALCFAISPAANAATVTVDFRGDGPYTNISRTGVPYKVPVVPANIAVTGIDGPPFPNSGVQVSQSALGLGVIGVDSTPDDTRKVETRVDFGESLRFDFLDPSPPVSLSGVRDIVIDFSLTSVLGFDPNADLLTVRAIGAGGIFAEQTFKFGSFFLSLKLPDIFNTRDTLGLELISTEQSAFIVESITFTVPVPAGLLLSTSSLLLLAPFALSRRRNRRKPA